MYSNEGLGFQLALPTNMVATSISNSGSSALYFHSTDEEFPGGGITITKWSQNLDAVQAQIAATLTPTETSTHTFNGIFWTVNIYTDQNANQQFIDAFTVFDGNVYEVGGLASPAVTNLLPALLGGFQFL
jgi:hypothetical protein